MIRCMIICLTIGLIWSCKTMQNTVVETRTAPVEADDWTYLFDGTSTAGWRAFNGDTLPPGWAVVDGTLTFTTEQILEQDYDYKGSRDIIYGAEAF